MFFSHKKYKPLISHKNYIGRESSSGPEFEPIWALFKHVFEPFPEYQEPSQNSFESYRGCAFCIIRHGDAFALYLL